MKDEEFTITMSWKNKSSIYELITNSLIKMGCHVKIDIKRNLFTRKIYLNSVLNTSRNPSLPSNITNRSISLKILLTRYFILGQQISIPS